MYQSSSSDFMTNKTPSGMKRCCELLSQKLSYHTAKPHLHILNRVTLNQIGIQIRNVRCQLSSWIFSHNAQFCGWWARLLVM